MSKEEILKSLEGKDFVTVYHSNGDESYISKHYDYWVVKSFMGNLLYTLNELVEEIFYNWDVEIIL